MLAPFFYFRSFRDACFFVKENLCAFILAAAVVQAMCFGSVFYPSVKRCGLSQRRDTPYINACLTMIGRTMADNEVSIGG